MYSGVSGNVGIGTSSGLGGRLVVEHPSSDQDNIVDVRDANLNGLLLGSTSTGGKIGARGTNQNLEFATAGTGKFTFTNGVVCVHTTTPESGFEFHVEGDARITGKLDAGTVRQRSDSTLKTGFRPVDEQEILAKVAELPITTWNYKTDDPSVQHIGPTAQDFHAAFGVGEDDKHISTMDADGVTLAAIQALYKENQKLRSQVEDLTKRLEALENASQ